MELPVFADFISVSGVSGVVGLKNRKMTVEKSWRNFTP